jgi:hypothetical protein
MVMERAAISGYVLCAGSSDAGIDEASPRTAVDQLVFESIDATTLQRGNFPLTVDSVVRISSGLLNVFAPRVWVSERQQRCRRL